jgi:pyruvyl transferase EpsI
VVAIVGGGNMGDMYSDLEEARLQVVKAFPRNRIVSFPQSIDFSDTASGRRALRRSRSIYESHPRLTLFARDTESHKRMRAAFPGAKVCPAPDTVLSMPWQSNHDRTVPLLSCIRSDKEAALSAGRREEILSALSSAVPGAIVTDTLVPGPRLDFGSYDRKLDELLDLFSRSRCIVTDRLHGLIFSVITRTPCVVIENSNHKIRSLVATWLPGLSSVRLLSQPSAHDVLRAVKDLEGCSPVRPNLDGAFAPLIAALRE